MIAFDIVIVIIAVAALAIAIAALLKAKAVMQALSERHAPMGREEEIAYCRGILQAARVAEESLKGEGFPAPLMLANERMSAARARERLRFLGIEA